MHVSRDIKDLSAEQKPVCLAAGFFDGLHRGHLRVVEAAVTRARAQKGVSWLLTFDPHPALVLRPADAPDLLMPIDQKLAYLERLGLDGCLLMPFTDALAQEEPEAFVSMLARRVPALAHISVGRNWRFGRQRRGDTRLLARMGRQLGFTVSVARSAIYRGEPISSSRIRSQLKEGALAPAARMLGRPPGLWGHVVPGNRIGRELGYPTANIAVQNAALPPFGIYAVRARIDGILHDGVLSYGVRPTIAEGAEPVFELHLFDFSRDLYGDVVEVFLLDYIREEQAFKTLDALRDQIAKDCAEAKRRLNLKKHKESLYIMNWPSV